MDDREQVYNDLMEVDSVVLEVIKQLISRSKIGKKKYGTDLDRNDLSPSQYLEETKQELLDASLYITKYKMMIDNFYK
jgi:hypothetical protein